MLSFPSVKINLGLYITERRADNYHTISSCFYPVPWNDVLEVVPSEQFEFIQTGLDIPGKKEDNLCVKAYHLLQSKYNFNPASVHLHKIIPMGAGLGGGSSDAAFTLKALNTLFKLGLSLPQLEEYAAQLGSDCAFFIQNRPVLAGGRGEIMEEVPLDLTGNHLYIVCPPIHISTAEAYKGVRPKAFQEDYRALLYHPASWKASLHNQFEDTLFPLYPQLHEIKQDLYDKGAWYATMSGSGSSIIGLFTHEIEHPDFTFPFFHVGL